jgi:hypothetical protein
MSVAIVLPSRSFLVAAVFLLINAVSGSAGAAELATVQCGQAWFSVFNSAVEASPFFVLSVRVPGKHVDFPFWMDREFFFVRCETTSKGTNVILLKHSCGGSGCATYNYGIIDTSTGSFLLGPGDGRREGDNDQEAARLIGHPVRPFSCTKKYSMTSESKEDDYGDRCFLSPLESIGGRFLISAAAKAAAH